MHVLTYNMKMFNKVLDKEDKFSEHFEQEAHVWCSNPPFPVLS